MPTGTSRAVRTSPATRSLTSQARRYSRRVRSPGTHRSGPRAGRPLISVGCYVVRVARSAPADADLFAPLADDVGPALAGELVGPVPQAQVDLYGRARQHGRRPTGRARGGHHRPVADPEGPGVPGVVGPDQDGVRLGGVQLPLAAGDEAHQQLVDPVGGQGRV